MTKSHKLVKKKVKNLFKKVIKSQKMLQTCEKSDKKSQNNKKNKVTNL